MYGCDSWSIKKMSTEELVLLNWVLEKTLESPLDCKKMQPVNPKRNQSWIFIGRSDAEAEAPILRQPDVKNWLIGKALDAGKNWRQTKGMIEDEMVGWHHRLDGHGFGWTLGVGDRQGGLACCGGHKESDTTERLNWLNWKYLTIVDLEVSLHTKLYNNPVPRFEACVLQMYHPQTSWIWWWSCRFDKFFSSVLCLSCPIQWGQSVVPVLLHDSFYILLHVQGEDILFIFSLVPE